MKRLTNNDSYLNANSDHFIHLNDKFAQYVFNFKQHI